MSVVISVSVDSHRVSVSVVSRDVLGREPVAMVGSHHGGEGKDADNLERKELII